MSALGGHLTTALKRAEAPGGVVGLFCNDKLDAQAYGWANRSAGIQADIDTLFPVGSIAKAYTATLVMQLVDELQVGLDTPVGNWLKGYRPSEPVTIRQLLCHASGIDGDFLKDFGRDTDAITRLVDATQTTAQLHCPGAFFSYCNVGYIILGRLLEVIYSASWDEILREKLLNPLGLARTVTLPDDALKHRFAIGENSQPFFPRSNGPSGMTMAASICDIIRFAKMHLKDGVAEDGARLLSKAAVRQMQSLQMEVPLAWRYRGWGLGWMLTGDGAFGHDGGVDGACAFLRIWPKQERILALMVNQSNAIGIWRELSGESLPEASAPPKTKLDLARYAGCYARYGQAIEVSSLRGELTARVHGEYAGKEMIFRLRPVATDHFTVIAEGLSPLPARFLPYGARSPAYLHVGDRLYRRSRDK